MLPLDLPGLNAVNAYLLADDHGFVLVDCGIYGRGRRSPDAQPGAAPIAAGAPDHGWNELVGALDAAGAGPEDVTRLVVTHHHADHYGMAARVLQAAGCELWMHARARQDLEV